MISTTARVWKYSCILFLVFFIFTVDAIHAQQQVMNGKKKLKKEQPSTPLIENETIIKKGDVITHSIRVKKGKYFFGKNDSLAPVLIVKGDNITIDFNGAELSGSKPGEQPDRFSGIGISILGGKNIIVKNAIIKGFRVGLMATGSDKLKIINSNFSYNYRQRLKSDRFKEDLSDWQSYHHNDHDQWLRFGAGIYLKNNDAVEIVNNVVTEN